MRKVLHILFFSIILGFLLSLVPPVNTFLKSQLLSVSAGSLSFSYVSSLGDCNSFTTVLKLNDNSADPGMALGEYKFVFAGPVCSYINGTSINAIVQTTLDASGASDPSWNYVYISEQTGFGCGAHTMQIYDRSMHTIRAANISNPCTQINYNPGSYNPKQIAASIAAANGWSYTAPPPPPPPPPPTAPVVPTPAPTTVSAGVEFPGISTNFDKYSQLPPEQKNANSRLKMIYDYFSAVLPSL